MKFARTLASFCILLFLFAVSTSSAFAIVFTRSVFVQNVTTNSVELRWKTDTNESVTVKYGTTTSYGSQVSSDSVNGGTQNHAKITGLASNTKYYYQLTSGTTDLTTAGDQTYFFKTAPTSCTSATPCTYAVIGDSGDASTGQKNVAAQIDANNPDMLMIAGDVVYDYSSDPEYNDARLFDIYANLTHNSRLVDIIRHAPLYATCGNHDSSQCTTLVNDQSLPQNGNAAGVVSTFSWDYGDIHFVAINSNASRTATSPQVVWMKNDLLASSKKWKIVMWHHNWWSAGSHSSDTSMEAVVKVAHDAGADAIFWGHSHVYERWNRSSVYPNVQLFTIGNGGKSGGSSCTSSSPGPGCDQRSGTISGDNAGFLLATTVDDTMTLQYITQNGSTALAPVVLSSNGAEPTVPMTVTSTPTPTKTPTPSPTTAVTSTLTQSPSPTIGGLLGDANGDGKVDGIDYITWLTNYNTTTTQGPSKGDFNRDGKIDGIDYIHWLNNYGKTASPQTFQPTAPYYATFFYPWSENPNTDSRWSYWNDSGNSPPNTWFSHYIPDPDPSNFDPSTELYSSRNDTILNWQLSKLKEAKLEVAISSWWGQNHKTDIAFRKIITDTMKRVSNPYPNLRWALYYENEGFGDPSEAQITSDLNYIGANYANEPGMLKINGKPVMFVYGGIEDTATSGYHTRWTNANNAASTKFYIVLKVYPGYTSVSPQPDSWHQYAPAVRSDNQSPYSYMVSPGFWLDDGSAVRLGRDLTSFRSAVTAMVNANATWKLIQTWNEWGEGTSVEPGEQVRFNATTGKEEVDPNGAPFKNLYVDALNELLPALEVGSQISNTLTATPTKTITPTPTVSLTTGAGSIIAAAGDIACGADSGGASCKHLETSDLLASINPIAVLPLGDIQYEGGSLSDFNNYYHPTWGRFLNITYPSVGNHEYLTANASGYFDYYNGVGNATGRAGERGKGYYAFNIGTWRLYALNSNCSQAGGCGAGSPQETWLRNDLQANPKACVLAYFHHPLYSSGGRASTGVRPLYQALYDFNADVILTGHDHTYERFAQQDANGNLDNVRGIRQFVVGTGGRNHTSFTAVMPNSEVRDSTSFGILKMLLSNNAYSWDFMPIIGSTFTDSGTTACH